MSRLRQALILVVPLLAACGEPTSTAPTSAPNPDVAGSQGITVALPPGWQYQPPLASVASDPVERVAVSRGTVTPAPIDRPCRSQVSDRVVPPDGAHVVVLEYTTGVVTSADDLPPRPIAFGPRIPGAGFSRIPVGGFECFDGRGWSFSFTEKERVFLAWVLLPPTAGLQTEADALRVLDTLHIASPGEARP